MENENFIKIHGCNSTSGSVKGLIVIICNNSVTLNLQLININIYWT